MANNVVLGNTTTISDTTATTHSGAHNNNGGAVAMLIMSDDDPTIDSGPTYGGVSMTAGPLASDLITRALIYYLLGAPGGSNTGSVTFTASEAAIVRMISLQNVDTRGVGQQNTSAGSGTQQRTVSVASTADSMFIACFTVDDASGDSLHINAPANTDMAANGIAGTTDQGITGYIQGDGGTVSITADWSNNDHRAAGAGLEFLYRPSGGSSFVAVFSKAWERWQDRNGLLAPKGFNEPILVPEVI